ncbi:MAG: DUF3577 domain-containing protein [Pseudomonas sp.]|uniref:DUF3577 domain-containing protein n=1 Tax=Pseudomonas TaxID=286 RepID=UPI0017E3073E|nr:DUF3577 domain-containing protein [Pseudomonas monteilii]MBA4682794.1 DUF3577 domain-containing protein [Pseudomonas sp.]MDD2126990.1 DUF3577 domain-containing protein [Pseudomonas monteilii]
MTTTSDSNQKSYFDIHTKGIGYIQRVRDVPVKGGQPFLACTIAALVGPVKSASLRYFDVRVAGADAKQLVRNYLGVDDRKSRPLVRFNLGDLWVDPFLRIGGEHRGEAAASLKARLLKAELIDRAELAQIEQLELVTWGIGYLNQPKETTRDGAPVLSCSIAALTGRTDTPADQREYRYFNTVVTGEDAQVLVRRYTQAVEAKQKVLIAFRLNDMQASPYIHATGEKIGQADATLESQLAHIGLIKVDGEQVYPLQSEATVTEGEQTVLPEDDSDRSQLGTPEQPPVEVPAQAASF